MKFIHFSDIRIGSSAESGTPWEAARLDEIRSGIDRIMAESEAAGAKLVIISGGLFSHRPVTAELEEINMALAAYPLIHVVIIAGETDSVWRSSPVRCFNWAFNVHYCMTGAIERFKVSRVPVIVYASSVTDNEETELKAFNEAAAADAEESGKAVRIAVLRADDAGAVKEAFAAPDGSASEAFAYVAVGSASIGRRSIADNIYCPGRFEPEEMSDSGQHGIYIGTINDDTGRLEKIDFKPMAAVSYIPLVVRTSIETTQEELTALIGNEMQRRGVNNIYRLKLTGARNPELIFDAEGLKAQFRISELIDETEPEYDYKAIFEEHSQDLLGFYAAEIVNNRREMSAVERKAMYYGLDALIRTSDTSRGTEL